MKFLVEFNPPPEVKNALEKNPELQKKMGEILGNMKLIAAWFTLRRGFFVVEANSNEELSRKVGPLFHIFKIDANISPAISLEEFAGIPAAIGDELKKYSL